jgi:hypothetical protein
LRKIFEEFLKHQSENRQETPRSQSSSKVFRYSNNPSNFLIFYSLTLRVPQLVFHTSSIVCLFSKLVCIFAFQHHVSSLHKTSIARVSTLDKATALAFLHQPTPFLHPCHHLTLSNRKCLSRNLKQESQNLKQTLKP